MYTDVLFNQLWEGFPRRASSYPHSIAVNYSSKKLDPNDLPLLHTKSNVHPDTLYNPHSDAHTVTKHHSFPICQNTADTAPQCRLKSASGSSYADTSAIKI